MAYDQTFQKPDVQESKFNMGLASLQAIRKNMDEFYLYFKLDRPIEARGALEIIYWEAYSDFSPEERVQFEKELNEIADLVNHHSEEYAKVTLYKTQKRNYDSMEYVKAKGKLWNSMRNFYHKSLLVAMDSHGLLRPKKADPNFAAFQ